MSERIEIEPDAKTKRVISELHGAAIALDALHHGDGKPRSELPGFALAVALIEAAVADMRARMAGAVYRSAAKAGHDVAKLSSIYTALGKDGTPKIEMEPADLVDQAESQMD